MTLPPNIVRSLLKASSASGLRCAVCDSLTGFQGFLHREGTTQSQALITPTDMLLSYAGHRED